MNPRLGVMIIGAKGAVSTTVLAAHCAQRNGRNLNFQLPSEADSELSSCDLVPLSDVVFGGWDLVADSYSQAAQRHGVVPPAHLAPLASALDALDAFAGHTVGGGQTRRAAADRVAADLAAFKKRHQLARVVVVDLSPTEPYVAVADPHRDLARFERALDADAAEISTGMVYAYAAIKSGCAFVSFTPSRTIEIPVLVALAEAQGVPLAGKDGKTGQTLYKTVLAPMFRDRGLKISGWFSTNILGNGDGENLNHPERAATKVETKRAALPSILGYDDFSHQVHIHYYPPRGDAKEAWDTIDFQGWFGVPMQMKVNWLGWDSILAAPLVADLVRWVDHGWRHGEKGLLVHLAPYFKQPLGTQEHDFFRQQDLLRRYARAHKKG